MFLFGASGHAKVIADILEQMGEKWKELLTTTKNSKNLWECPLSITLWKCRL